MSRYLTSTGIVINKRNSQESDLVITLLTPELGKIVATAKGAKNIKSSRLSTLQLGNTIKVHLYQKDDRFWISQSLSIVNFLRHPKNLSQLNLLFFFLELINRVIAENQQINGIYTASENLILAINHHSAGDYIQAEIKFINLLGFGLPSEIQDSFTSQRYHQCQQLIQQFLENITEKKFESQKLAR